MIKEVVVSRDGVEDLEEGRVFYERRQPGIGDYFWDSLLSDMESLTIFAGVHAKQYGFSECSPRDFHTESITKSIKTPPNIVAMLPMRRDPAWIEARVRSRR